MLDLILDKVRAINAEGAAVLIAEQNARRVLRLAHHCYVMENGTVAFHGTGTELMHDERIERTYLGASH
jgi:branched-chain amino acid transport system ATP-binding protein